MHAVDAASPNEMPNTAGSSALDGLSNDGRYLTLAAIERQAIEARVRMFGGKKGLAAKSLHIGRNRLARKLAEYKAADARAGGR